jgi:predicted DsbA family dithiol-disulfide isomerase
MNELTSGSICGPDGCEIAVATSNFPAISEGTTLNIQIVSDAICPWCYVAKRNFERAASQLPKDVNVTVQWLPYELNPDMPADGKDRRAYRSAKFGSWERSQALDADVAAAGAQVGLVMRHDLMQRTPNTFRAHRLIWLANQEGVQDAVVEALFGAYFVEGLDVGNVDVLVNIGVNAGIDVARMQSFFDTTLGVAEVSQASLSARQSGISGVPTFVINGQAAFSGAQRPERMLDIMIDAIAAS